MHMIDRVTVNNAVRMTDMCIWKNDAAKKKGGGVMFPIRISFRFSRIQSESSNWRVYMTHFLLWSALYPKHVSNRSCTVSTLGSWWSTILLLLLLYCLIIFVFSRCYIEEVASSHPRADRHVYQFEAHGAEKIIKIIFCLIFVLVLFDCS